MATWTLKSCALIVSTSFSCAWAAQCNATRWIDGDTADMAIGGDLVRVRLAGFDAPERGQPYWRDARDFAAATVADGAVCDCYKVDRYKRAVCTVRVRGTSLAVVMAGAGLACIDARFEGEAARGDRRAARAALEQAQAQRLRMWSNPGAVCAVDYRRSKNANR